MSGPALLASLRTLFRDRYGRPPEVAAYAPGRVEVLGNHTDYNEGWVLSAAIDLGTYFVCRRRDDGACRLLAGDVLEEAAFDAAAPAPSQTHAWSNYVKGVLAGLAADAPAPHGFDAAFLGNVPLGAGLSSSAALEMSAGLALAALYGRAVEPLRLARIGQAAEHRFAGVKCGLLDQLTSLHGRDGMLVETDFRTFAVTHAPLGPEACLLLCNTHARHALVDG